MQVDLECTLIDGTSVRRQHVVALPRLLKHFVMAGAGFSPNLEQLRRGVGALLWYWDFFKPVVFGGSFFGEPEPILRNPTLKAHFSNLVGCAFADHCARTLADSWATFSYEGVLAARGLPCVGDRPDLLGVSPRHVVALEAKGFAKRSVSSSELADYKRQANAGPLPKHASAASVAYALYSKVGVKYIDPVDNTSQPEPNDSLSLIQDYLRLIETSARESKGEDVEIEGRRYRQLSIWRLAEGDFQDGAAVSASRGVALLLDLAAAARITSRERSEDASIVGEVESTDLFIDRDGIGVRLA